MNDAEELALLNELKKLPDFESFPLPPSWFKKYNIPPRTACGPKEYINSNYAIECSVALKDLPPLIINKPQKDKDGAVILVEMVKVEEEILPVRQRPFKLQDGEDFPIVLVDENDEIVKKD